MFVVVSAASILEEELERLKLEVWFPEMRVFAVVSAASMLEEELLRLRLEV